MAAVGARRATPPGPGPALWGLARREALEASHPAFVTRHVTTWKHAPFSTAPRVCLRLGVVQNQRFSGPHGHHLAPSWASSQKNPEKTGKNVLKNGAKWRFFGSLERHFAVPAADGARSQHDSLQDFRSVESGSIEPAAAPGKSEWSAIFHGRGHGSTCASDHRGARNTRDRSTNYAPSMRVHDGVTRPTPHSCQIATTALAPAAVLTLASATSAVIGRTG